ncbi:MAG TPA: recombinase family protein [Candidatus Angelobacter sp.]|nr:recombinase family protein [Candidatus Angelobacter sp.]
MTTQAIGPQASSLRVALYSRVSTKDQDNENQLTQLREYCQRQGYAIVAEYVDVCSGAKAERPRQKEMFLHASQRKFDVLLFWSLDRLSREGVLPTLNYLQQLTSYGVGYLSFTEQYLDSLGVFRDAVLGILAAVARQEKIRISERTKAGLLKARADGRVGGRPSSLTPDQKEQAKRLRREGKTWTEIAPLFRVHPDTIKRIVSGKE